MKNTMLLPVAVMGLLSATSMAALITATGSFEINQFGVSGDRDRSLAGQVGNSAGFVVQRFVLPTLAPGETFDTASLTVPVGVFFNGGGNNQGFDLDLYGLNATDSFTR